MMQIVESSDGYDVPEAAAPQVFERNFEWMTFEDTKIKPEELPKPTTWHVLIMPKQPRKMSKGGIELPQQVQDIEAHQNYIGQVVAMGPLAGMPDRFKNPSWRWYWPFGQRYLWDIKVGDWVIYGKYSGMAKVFKGVRFLTINDDAITDVIDSPEGFAVLV